MFSKFILLLSTLAVLQRSTLALVVDADLQVMSDEVANQTVFVTQYAANENPNTLTEQREIGVIIGKHINSFDNAFAEELKNLLHTIENERQNAGVNSPKALCLKLQATKIEPTRGDGQNRARGVQADVDKRVNDLVENTRQLIEQTKLDIQVKTIVQLCMKLYTNIGQDKERLTCFDDYGTDLTVAQKSRGETLLERVGIMQQECLRVSQRADAALRQMYAQNELAYSQLNTAVQKCLELPNTYLLEILN